MLAIVHANPRQPHQVRQAMQFADGLDRHNISYAVTADKQLPGDLHICLGPNYALEFWRSHPRTILLDRCFYGGENTHVTLGWAKASGGRRFPAGDDSRWRTSGQHLGSLRLPNEAAILLGDYAEDRHRYGAFIASLRASHPAVRYRGHPRQEPWSDCPVERLDGTATLEAALEAHGTAAGFLTSALVVAGLRGLNLIAMHPGSIAARWRAEDRDAWSHAVAWANWAETEIGTGDAVAWLLATEQETATLAAPC